MLEIKNVSKKFGKKQVLQDVSFTINPGEITCLIGENGSGKTTLMNLLMKLVPSESGEFLIDNEPIDFADFNRISYIPDQMIVLKQMTIQEALDFMATYYTAFNAKRADEMLEFFRLNRQDRIANLSKGNVAKVNLLLGLTLDTDYVLMDEPFSGIDLLTREEIASVFTTKMMEGRGVLISTHEISDIEMLIDKVVMLKDGSIIKEFYPEDIRSTKGQSIIDMMREVYR
ncbi:ATP-binding cassette domain-containing protein [Ruoffia tabacinasalis]|uniref:ATP-binding cassette domain-containing protein n=1 Tax=Ruoffia tabacinasalis TaxID=87458 RepID=UPI003F9E4C94